jgi:molybdopterin synthase catalytic subunit
MMTLPFLTDDPIDAETLEDRVRTEEHGAVVTFQGVVRRDRTDIGVIDHLVYEAYVPMAEREFSRILKEVSTRWPQAAAVIQHRVGRVNVGETSVFCRHAIDQIKTAVPLWKKDVCSNGKSEWTVCHHETMLLADTSVVIPQS